MSHLINLTSCTLEVSERLPPDSLLCISPQGVLRIHFLEAQDLEGKDKFLGGLIKGKSDPYGVLQIGNQLFQSKTVKESLHPKWNEVYEVTSLLLSRMSQVSLGVKGANLRKRVCSSNLREVICLLIEPACSNRQFKINNFSFLHQALVYEHSGQHLEIELFDEDPDKDDFLGR